MSAILMVPVPSYYVHFLSPTFDSVTQGLREMSFSAHLAFKLRSPGPFLSWGLYHSIRCARVSLDKLIHSYVSFISPFSDAPRIGIFHWYISVPPCRRPVNDPLKALCTAMEEAEVRCSLAQATYA
jgi:hypothetical protein